MNSINKMYASIGKPAKVPNDKLNTEPTLIDPKKVYEQAQVLKKVVAQELPEKFKNLPKSTLEENKKSSIAFKAF